MIDDGDQTEDVDIDVEIVDRSTPMLRDAVTNTDAAAAKPLERDDESYINRCDGFVICIDVQVNGSARYSPRST